MHVVEAFRYTMLATAPPGPATPQSAEPPMSTEMGS